MLKYFFILFFCAQLCFAQTGMEHTLPTQGELKVVVHPGVELLSVIHFLSGEVVAEPSSYQLDVLDYFRSHLDHPVIEKVKSLSESRIYFDFNELGFLFSGFPKMEIGDIQAIPAYWFEAYGEEHIKEYIHLVEDFYQVTDFWNFYRSHEAEYAGWGEELKRKINEDYSKKQADFFRMPDFSTNILIYFDALNRQGAHAVEGIDKMNSDYQGLKAHSLNYTSSKASFTKPPSFKPDLSLVNLIWHESNHLYVEQLCQEYAQNISDLSRLFNSENEELKAQNIDTWAYCFNENLVRGLVIAFNKLYLNDRAFEYQKKQEIRSGFIYSDDIAELILSKYAIEGNEDSFEDFFPSILKMMHGLSKSN